MTHFTYPQLERLWVKAGGPRRMAPVMAAIAEVESHGDSEPTPGKLGNNPDTATGLPGAEGLWQMEWPLYQGYAGAETPEQMLDPLTNAAAAVELAHGDPSTAPGHPIYDNWIRWEGTIGGQPAYLAYLHPGTAPAPGPPARTRTAGQLGIGQLALIAVFVLAGAAAAVLGVARTARTGKAPA